MKHTRRIQHPSEEYSEGLNTGESTSTSQIEKNNSLPKSTFKKNDALKLKVLIADDSKEVRNRLKEMVQENKSITLMGESEDAVQAITALQQLKPDVVILDIHMPGGGGMRVLKDIKRMNTGTIAIIFTAFAFAQYRQAYLGAGADYFFDKTHDVQKMIDTLDELGRKHFRGRDNDKKRGKHS